MGNIQRQAVICLFEKTILKMYKYFQRMTNNDSKEVVTWWVWRPRPLYPVIGLLPMTQSD